MKQLISPQQFLVRQPSYPDRTATSDYYLHLANILAQTATSRGMLKGWPESVVARCVLGITGYFQDILTDSGIWRSFVEQHKALYGRWIPFYPTDGDYVPHELNEADIRFLVWYTLCMNYENRRVWDPEDPAIAEVASLWHSMLDKVYDDAPEPEGFFIWKGLELGNHEEENDIIRFSHWLYMHCYLLTPAYAVTLGEILSRPGMQDPHNLPALQGAIEDSMTEVPTGPLALYLREWLCLILDGKMPPAPAEKTPAEVHPTYAKFVAATGGAPIAFIKGYDELNRFFIEALGWTAGEEHLPGMKQFDDFVLMVNPAKGMLVAHDICRCISLPENPYYDKEYARQHAIDLLTVRGCCPADLLHYLWEHDAIPDARFPGSDDCRLVEENRDFIARCYLQQYYRGD